MMLLPDSVSDEQLPIKSEKKVPHVNQSYWQKKIRSKRKKSQKHEKWMGSATIDPIAPSEQTPKYIYPCPNLILETMLKMVEKLDTERYGLYLQEETGLAGTLRSFIRNEAYEVFEGGDFNIEKLCSIGGEIPKGDGIYLHILWSEDSPFVYLYVGQSTETWTRLAHHNNPEYRARNNSLHYYVWTQLGPNAKSVWVMLSTPEVVVHPLALNLLEMWCALKWQTLPKSTLEKYLPNVPLSPRAGCHLNVASPLIQQTQSAMLEESGLGDLYASQDPLLKTYLQTRRKEYGQLKFADDPMLRDYFWENSRRGLKVTSKTVRTQMRRKFLDGCRQLVHFSKSHQWILICNATFNIAKGVVRIDHTAPLHVQCFIHEDSNPGCFAKDSTTDDASHVVVRIRGKNEQGEDFDLMARGSGPVTVSKMNHVYDVLVGRTEEESQSLPNRKWRTRAGRIRHRMVSDKRSPKKPRHAKPENVVNPHPQSPEVG